MGFAQIGKRFTAVQSEPASKDQMLPAWIICPHLIVLVTTGGQPAQGIAPVFARVARGLLGAPEDPAKQPGCPAGQPAPAQVPPILMLLDLHTAEDLAIVRPKKHQNAAQKSTHSVSEATAHPQTKSAAKIINAWEKHDGNNLLDT